MANEAGFPYKSRASEIAAELRAKQNAMTLQAESVKDARAAMRVF
jgi:hypothetical protein